MKEDMVIEVEQGGDFLKGRVSAETKMQREEEADSLARWEQGVGGIGSVPQWEGSWRDLTETEAGSQRALSDVPRRAGGRAPLWGPLKPRWVAAVRVDPLASR